jgi:hypothetical protein
MSKALSLVISAAILGTFLPIQAVHAATFTQKLKKNGPHNGYYFHHVAGFYMHMSAVPGLNKAYSKK